MPTLMCQPVGLTPRPYARYVNVTNLERTWNGSPVVNVFRPHSKFFQMSPLFRD